MSCCIAIQRGDKIMLGIGLTQEEIAALTAGRSLAFELSELQSFEPGERPEGLIIIPGVDHEDLMHQFAPFLPKARPETPGGPDGT